MDYLRIYDRFIASRKANQTPSCAYVEVHHIKPRSLGGTDEPDNLIRLTPEDHFFAHLLLAKGYRRRDLRAACIALAGFHNANGRVVEVIRARRSYGFIRRAYSAASRGEGGPNADLTVRTYYHLDGETFTGTRVGFVAAHGVSASMLNQVVVGKKEFVGGWSLTPISREDRDRMKSARRSDAGKQLRGFVRDKTLRHFYHVPTGVSVFATQTGMVNLGYLTRKKVSALVVGFAQASAGWCLAENAENADLRIVRTKWQGKVPEVYGATKQKAA